MTIMIFLLHSISYIGISNFLHYISGMNIYIKLNLFPPACWGTPNASCIKYISR